MPLESQPPASVGTADVYELRRGWNAVPLTLIIATFLPGSTFFSGLPEKEYMANKIQGALTSKKFFFRVPGWLSQLKCVCLWLKS